MSANEVPHDATEWEARADVLHHFYAYHFFDQTTPNAPSIDSDSLVVVNLDDADVQYFNRTAAITRGLNTGHKLAEYLISPHAFKLSKHYPAQADDDHTANTYRRRFIHHVRAYNMTQEPRRRFYLVNLVEDDMAFLKGLEPANGVNDGSKKPNLVTDGCLSIRALIAPNSQIEDVVGIKLERFMSEPHTPKADDIALQKSMSDLRLSFSHQKSNPK